MQAEHYVLTVQAQDSGVRAQTSTVSVYVNVIDDNDNSPIFDPSSYSIDIWENATVGSSLMQVAATDSEAGK